MSWVIKMGVVPISSRNCINVSRMVVREQASIIDVGSSASKILQLQQENASDHEALLLAARKLKGYLLVSSSNFRLTKLHASVISSIFLAGSQPPPRMRNAIEQHGIDLVKRVVGRTGPERWPGCFSSIPSSAVGTDIALLALEEDVAFGRIDQAQEHLWQGGLAASGLAHDGDNLAFVEIEIHAIDGDGFIAAKAEFPGDTSAAQARFSGVHLYLSPFHKLPSNSLGRMQR